MTGSMKNLLVGIFILAAIATLVAIIMFLKPTVGDGKQTLYVRFSDIGALNVGTRVSFGGRPVGEVVAMEEIPEARKQPSDSLGRVYFYQLTLHVDSSVNVYNTDEISIQRSGLMGERSISITPKTPPQGVTPRLVGEQPIYADSVDTLQNALLDFSDLSATMEDTFRKVRDWIHNYGDDVAVAIQETGGAFGSAQIALDQMQEADAFRNAGAVVESLKSASNSFDTVCSNLACGKGTAGKLIDGDDLYLQLNAVMTKANTLMNDLNHYGILFHLNKQWQRTRLKKISELNALSTPQNFQTYFQNEVDDINASMSRISMLINKAEGNPNRSTILSNPQFKRDFAELLRKADELSDNLRLYNQQLNEATGSP